VALLRRKPDSGRGFIAAAAAMAKSSLLVSSSMESSPSEAGTRTTSLGAAKNPLADDEDRECVTTEGSSGTCDAAEEETSEGTERR